VSSTFYPARRAHGVSVRRRLIGGAAGLAVGAAVVIAVVAQPRAAAPVGPAPLVARSAPTVAPIEAYAVDGPQGYEWRVRSAMDGYAIVEGPFGFEVIGRDAASAPAIGGLVAVRVSSGDPAGAALRLVAPEDGYYDEGSQGYEWRLRPGR
jgi:hypothetical protein